VKDKLEAAAEANPELKAVLDKVEKAEDMAKADIDKVKKFNPKDLLKKKIHVYRDPDLGEVSFGDLTVADSMEIAKGKDESEKGMKIIYLSLHKAYPDLTFEEVKEFPLSKVSRLINVIAEQTGFLPPKK
jgi:hypothetical protein